MDIPSVNMRSSQAFSSFTVFDHVTPVLSVAVAVEIPVTPVAVVIIDSGRRGDSIGGCNMLTISARSVLVRCGDMVGAIGGSRSGDSRVREAW